MITTVNTIFCEIRQNKIMSETLEIDGSIGGGSVLRVALPLAIGLKKEITIYNIRKNRSKPGLRTQHLVGVNALASITNSKVSGNTIGSGEIHFIPGTSNLDDIDIHANTAASISLVFQAICNFCIAAQSKVKVNFNGGGTHTEWSPSFDYLTKTFAPVLEMIGIHTEFHIDKFGFYPKGGALGSFSIDASNGVSVFDFSGKSTPLNIEAYVVCSSTLEKANVAERIISSVNSNLNSPIVSYINYVDSLNPGIGITSVISYENGMRKGMSILGKKGVPSENIGKQMSELVKNELSSSGVDEHMADQLLLPLAFSKGSQYRFQRVTDHVKVNLEILKQIIGDGLSYYKENEGFIVKCE